MLSAADRQAAADVLSLLKRRPMGRRALLQVLLEDGAYMTEYRLRAILGHLHQLGCVSFGRGRSGCTITPAGEALMGGLRK